jgi:aryl-alcohol dehydrogenase-like predicted oxidoreductase
MRELGRTGERVSLMCLGGWHVGAGILSKPEGPTEAEAIRMMHAAIDEGVNFFDNAWDYHNGWSEELMGKALAMDGKRDKVFLMTKNCERDYEGSLRDLDDSLRRFQTDRIDLWQFHELVYDNDPDWIFERGGIRAAIEAQRAGKVRFIGFTGHKDPRIHLKMLGKPHAWDVALMPISAPDALYRSFLEEVVPVCHDNGVGVMGMKSLGGGYPDGALLTAGVLSVDEAHRFALSQPIASLVMGIRSMEQLHENIQRVRNFVPMSEEEQSALLTRIYETATDGRYERFKSTTAFDGPHHRKQHGFD